jgi:hypothetical protein
MWWFSFKIWPWGTKLRLKISKTLSIENFMIAYCLTGYNAPLVQISSINYRRLFHKRPKCGHISEIIYINKSSFEKCLHVFRCRLGSVSLRQHYKNQSGKKPYLTEKFGYTATLRIKINRLTVKRRLTT